MAKNIQTPDSIRIAALEKKQVVHRNLMEPGSGTPWEDRGTHGLVGAFFRTCMMSLSRPVELFNSIRRPDTSSDTTQFVIACGVVWAISALIHSLIRLVLLRRDQSREIYTNVYFLGTALLMALIIVGLWLLLKLASSIYLKITGSEMKSKAPPVLMYNIFAYALGPSILALIPIIGPALALVWIFALMIVAGAQRQYISWRGAIVGVVLTVVAVGAIAAAALFVADLVFTNVTGGAIEQPIQVGA